jgi:hypothetical protein
MLQAFPTEIYTNTVGNLTRVAQEVFHDHIILDEFVTSQIFFYKSCARIVPGALEKF